ncbi:hypothetical protein C7212DRAFT_232589, partial [Tuber magnatum]
VHSLRVSLEDYWQVRDRFISTSRRDKLKIVDNSDNRVIWKANDVVHGGDVVADAMLYRSPGGRNDPSTFKTLYGLGPGQISRIKYKPTIAALNFHASVVASSRKSGNEEFYASFKEFIRCLEVSDYNESYLDGGKPDSSLTRAYRKFSERSKDGITCDNKARVD